MKKFIKWYFNFSIRKENKREREGERMVAGSRQTDEEQARRKEESSLRFRRLGFCFHVLLSNILLWFCSPKIYCLTDFLDEFCLLLISSSLFLFTVRENHQRFRKNYYRHPMYRERSREGEPKLSYARIPGMYIFAITRGTMLHIFLTSIHQSVYWQILAESRDFCLRFFNTRVISSNNIPRKCSTQKQLAQDEHHGVSLRKASNRI